MIDTHSHIFAVEFNEDRDEVVARGESAGVTHIIMPAIDALKHEWMFNVARQYKNHYPTMGVHPTHIEDDYRRELDIAEEFLHDKKDEIVAIGEIGLDKYWDTTYIMEQEQAFRIQLEWAVNNNLPAIIHTRDAWEDMINILSDFKGSSLRAILHGFSGTPQQAEKILSMGRHMIGIGGVITYKKSILPDVVKEIGLDYIVTETDAPYLAPVPYRGKRNESSYIPIIIERIANILDIESNICAEKTALNAMDIFPALQEYTL